MQAVCIDGTVIEADQIKEQQQGIRLEEKPQKQGGSSKPRMIGFVPYDRLMYVIPDDVVHNIDELDEIPT